MIQPQTLFDFDNSFAREMDGFYTEISAEKAPAPELILFNEKLAEELNFDSGSYNKEGLAEILSGNAVPTGATPIAQAYAGHQFGGFSPSLGDGRALLLGEVFDKSGIRRDVQLKGSGRTPFSRNGDGKAALGPVLREYLFSEAMHALGVPTTRSLAAATTGSDVYREKPLPGAVLTRIASSHIRVGTFQFFAARGLTDKVRQLADYTIQRHDPDLVEKPGKYLLFLDRVIDRQTRLIAKWMSTGFIHGVMNTDNMTISGETIDYGPCAFMDAYHPETVFSSIDDHGRYAYTMQPVMAQWNLARLAECMLDLIDPGNRDNAVSIATEKIEQVAEIYKQHWMSEMRLKLGLAIKDDEDLTLINDLLTAMHKGKADFTQTFRKLSLAIQNDDPALLELFETKDAIVPWLERWRVRLEKEVRENSASIMDRINPIYIPRNHHVERVLKAAVEDNDLQPFKEFFEVLKNPFTLQADKEYLEGGAPKELGPHITYCGT